MIVHEHLKFATFVIHPIERMRRESLLLVSLPLRGRKPRKSASRYPVTSARQTWHAFSNRCASFELKTATR